MKKLILPLLTVLVILSSCEKEDDILQPIPPNPTTTVNTTNNGDTIITVGDTIITVEDTTINTNNEVTVLSPSPTFVCEGKKYNVVMSEYEHISSENTPYFGDSSYYFRDSDGILGMLILYPNNNTLHKLPYLMSKVCPGGNFIEGSTHPEHFNNGLNSYGISNWSYVLGYVTFTLGDYDCNGQLVGDTWEVVMKVTEYSDGKVELTIDTPTTASIGMQAAPPFGPYHWSSNLKIVLEEEL